MAFKCFRNSASGWMNQGASLLKLYSLTNNYNKSKGEKLLKVTLLRTKSFTKIIHTRDSYLKSAALNKHPHFFTHSPIHRTYICVRLTDGAARIFLWFLSLILPEQGSLLVKIIPSVRERDRAHGGNRRRKRLKTTEKNTRPGFGFEPTATVSKAKRSIH